MRIQIFRAVLDHALCAGALAGGGDVEDAGFDATGAEATPVPLGQAQDERLFGRIVRLEGFAEAAEDLIVLMLEFVREDYQRG